MTKTTKPSPMRSLATRINTRINSFRLPLATKLILSFLFIIAITSVTLSVAGVQILGNRILEEAQEKVRTDLNAGREIYLSKMKHVNDVVRLTADRFFLKEAIMYGNIQDAAGELVNVKNREELDILTVTDRNGKVILRTSNLDSIGDDQSHDEIVKEVLEILKPVSATSILSAEALHRESPELEALAYFKFIDTPKARPRPETEETAGMLLKAAAPIFDYDSHLIGMIYGGVLLNRNFEIVDKIKQTVFQDVIYDGKDIGTATIFQDDVRISTNVRHADGTRAIGTRVAERVYNQVVLEGKPWIGRAFVVNNWYITAYEPIKNIQGDIIGILYVGILEQKYVDIRKQTVLVFLAITLLGVAVSVVFSYVFSRQISGSLKRLVSGSREIAHGNLDAKVKITSTDELGELAGMFNEMAIALKERDERLKEFATRKIMESERLALIGQLSANVAHELNNPLQGIVTYSHLLLEKMMGDDPRRSFAAKIVVQANRCRDIIRGLLDFSRQRKPEKIRSNVNAVLKECISLIENQAIFHNIQIVENYQEDLPLVVLDPSQIVRVFMNLIINAAEAMEGNGTLTLRTRTLPEKDSIEIEIADTGCGISPENIEKIFDPFFTTKEVGHGTGLGLAISYGIIKSHKGSLSVESEMGKGTTFTVRLPVTILEESVENGRKVTAVNY